jgi:hypothetical protein
LCAPIAGAIRLYRKDSFIVTLGAGRRDGHALHAEVVTEPIVSTLSNARLCRSSRGQATQRAAEIPAQLLALKVCDMAWFRAFVQTCRWLGERSRRGCGRKGGRAISIGAFCSTRPATPNCSHQAERVLIARRLIASAASTAWTSIDGVELAKLSLWLITMMRNRLLSFLDHWARRSLSASANSNNERFATRSDDAQPLETANLWRT